MSDVQSQFEAVEQPIGSQFDLARIDRNLQQISTVEQTWSRPALPEMVKMDLASMPDVTEDGLFAFLTGIDDALRRVEEDEDQVEPQFERTEPPVVNTGLDQVQIIAAALSNNPAPEAITADAVKEFKAEAIRKGFLDMDPRKIDSSWSPGLRRIQGEMAFDEYNSELRGDDLGSTTVERMTQLLNDFTSPAGLLSAATELDLWWDRGQISGEISSWGDKFRKLGESKSAIEWGGNLLDALTGPIDDLVIPVVNLGLFFTGFGAVANTARIGWQVGRGIKTLDGLDTLYRSSRVAKWTGARAAVRNMRELGRPGMLATRWQKRSSGARKWTGNRMAGWRDNLAVRTTKGIVQPGMRLGLVSQVEDRIGTYGGGEHGLSDFFEPVSDVSERLYLAGQTPVTVLPEILIAPYNIFVPGTFMRQAGQGADIFGRVGRGLKAGLGTVGGRAAVGGLIGAAGGTITGDDAGGVVRGAAVGAGAGALAAARAPVAVKTGAIGAGAGALLGDDPEDALFGAGAGVGLFVTPLSVRKIMRRQTRTGGLVGALRGLSRGLETLSFKPVSDQHEVSMAFNRGRVTELQMKVDTAATAEEAAAAQAKLDQWNSDVQISGVRKALAREQGHMDEEMAAASITWTYIAAMIDHIANVQARTIGGAGVRGRYLHASNKLTSQLRPFHWEGVPTEQLLDDLTTSIAYTRAGPDASRKSVVRIRKKLRKQLAENPELAYELANQHNMKATETLRQLFSPTNVPQVDDLGEAGMDILAGQRRFHSTGMRGRALIMERYMPQVGDTFGAWPHYIEMTDELKRMRLSGVFDPAVLKPARTAAGHRKKLFDVPRWERNKAVDNANEEIFNRLVGGGFDPNKLEWLNVTPGAPSVLPGRLTVMRLGTASAQQLDALAEEIIDVERARDNLQRLEGLGWRRHLADVDPNVSVDQIEATLRQLGKKFFPGKDANKAWRQMVDYAKRKKLTLGQLQTAIEDNARALADDADRWTGAGFKPTIADDVGRELRGFDALAARKRELREQIPFAAKEVDTDELIAFYRGKRIGEAPKVDLDPKKLSRLEKLKAKARRTDFPEEAGTFDEKAEELLEAELGPLRERAGPVADGDKIADEIESFVAQLRKAGYKLVHGTEFLMPEDLTNATLFDDITRRHLNFATLGNFFRGRLPMEAHILEDTRHRAALVAQLSDLPGKRNITPDSPEVDEHLDILRAFLRDKQADAERLTMDLDRQTRTGRTINRLKSSQTPIRLDDLQAHQDEIIAAIRGKGFDEETALAVWRATADFRNKSFRDLGIYALEARLRSHNQAAGALKLLSRSKAAQALLGGSTGAQVGRYSADEDASFDEQLGKILIGGAVGIGAGLGGGALVRAAPKTLLHGRSLATRAVDRAENWRYGYMADVYARARDSLRFTLSPFFDASRYTEGMMLGKTAAPLRKADGSRLALPTNMTPRKLRRELAKIHGPDRAREIYNARIGQFQKFARDHQDFDPEALDVTGRWFKQVGILGFSPVDWMGTAFARLIDEGLEAEDAYQAVRRMYTYGTNGRSGAEMSVNFLFFPFSFQKKALKHLGQWMHDDLGRSIIIHDALKTYEVLDEEFNLEERWRDHFPWLQQLQRLNLFAYGLSAGRFGGINSQLFESGSKIAWNAFVPAGLKIKDVSAKEELVGSPESTGRLGGLAANLLPVWNDTNWMIQNLADSGHIISSPEHVTRGADVRRGWGKWNEFKTEFDERLREKGYTLGDIFNKPWLSDAKALYESKRSELRDQHPEWFRSHQEFIGEITAIEMQRRQHLDRYTGAVRAGRTPDPDDEMIAAFETLLDDTKRRLKLMGISSLADAPPELNDALRARAAEFARRNSRWTSLWGTFYEPELGPITMEREL